MIPHAGALNLHDLTLEERAALERAVDGPITSVMVADILREPRSAFSPGGKKRLVACVAADLAFYRNRILALELEIAAVTSDRDQIYGGAEQDRKTRHLAALNCQRDGLVAHCRPYEALLSAARADVAAEGPANVAAAIYTPSESLAGPSGD